MGKLRLGEGTAPAQSTLTAFPSCSFLWHTASPPAPTLAAPEAALSPNQISHGQGLGASRKVDQGQYSPPGHTPWGAGAQPGYQRGSPHRLGYPGSPPKAPLLLPHPSCCPAGSKATLVQASHLVSAWSTWSFKALSKSRAEFHI